MGTLTELSDRIADVHARDHVRAVTRQSGSSFFWAIRSLDSERREAMYAVYAFCRQVDDIADETTSISIKKAQLEEWRQEIERVFDERAETDTGRVLQQIIDPFNLDKRDFDAIINGMLTDSETTVCIEDMDELRLYMDCVACAVGRMITQILHIDPPDGVHLAKCMGEALQLTNILRDLDEDGERGRLYLPTKLLRENGILDSEPSLVLEHPALSRVCDKLANMAVEQFTEARVILASIQPKNRKPLVLMLEAYWLILVKLRARGWLVPRKTVSPSTLERFLVFARFGLW